MTAKRKSSSPKGAEASGSSPPSPEAPKQTTERKAPPTVKRAPVRKTGSPPPMCSVHGPNCPGGHKSKSKR